MSNRQQFDAAFARLPLVAILRGIEPDEAVPVGEALVEAGFVLIEVPLNSPQPFESIRRLAERFDGTDVMIGAGTVLDAAAVEQVGSAAGTLVIAPNANTEVIRAAADRGMVPIPGIATPTEAFAALEAGAAALKLFPAEVFGPAAVRAMLAVLPPDTRILPVGGIAPDAPQLRDWLKSGAAGFGLGSALYKRGMSAAEMSSRAAQFVAALDKARAP